MAETTKIEWTDATWNPITGCSVVSPGCTNCYAMRLAGTRLAHHPSRAGLTRDTKAGPVWTGEVRLNEQWLDQPLRWKRPRMVFVCAHGDLFAEGVPDAWIDKVFAVMALSPQHTFQVLTKRSARMREYLSHERRPHQVARAAVDLFLHRKLPSRMPLHDRWPVKSIGDIDLPHDITLQTWPLPNVWLGVSVEDQTRANDRLKYLIATPAAVRWVSAEPLLGPVDLTHWFHSPMDMAKRLDWVVVGGESGPGARPMHPDWARSLRDQCAAAGVPFLFKQWGEWWPRDQWEHNPDLILPDDDYVAAGNALGTMRLQTEVMHCVGKARAGRLLDGVEHHAFPEIQP